MKCRLGIVVAALVILGGITGCPRGSGKIKLAFISNNAHDFWKIAEKGTQQAEKDFGVEVEFKMPGGGGTADQQQKIMEDLLTRGVKGIAISPNDAANLMDFFKKVKKDGVPLVMQDSDVPDPALRRCYIGTHNYRAGRAAGELALKAAPEGGKIVIFVGKLDVSNAVERRQGVLDVLAGIDRKEIDPKAVTPPDAANVKFGKYLLLETRTDGGKRETCKDRADEILTKHNDIACMIGLWEYNPPAMLLAVKASKHAKKPIIVGFDEAYETLDGIKDGSVIGTIVQNPYKFGYESMKILAALAKGDESILKQYPDMDSQNRIFIPHRVITNDNVEAFYTELKKLKGEK